MLIFSFFFFSFSPSLFLLLFLDYFLCCSPPLTIHISLLLLRLFFLFSVTLIAWGREGHYIFSLLEASIHSIRSGMSYGIRQQIRFSKYTMLKSRDSLREEKTELSIFL